MIRFLILFAAALAAHAGVVRLEVHERSDVLDGKAFGAAGPYERAVGRVYFTADPANSNNSIIVDLDRAPRNAQGQVEYSADFHILKPRDPAKGNGAVLFDVVNRGRKLMVPIFQRGTRPTIPGPKRSSATAF
jgi:hypothetical protein